MNLPIPGLESVTADKVALLLQAWVICKGLPEYPTLQYIAQVVKLEFDVVRYWFHCRLHLQGIQYALANIPSTESLELPPLEKFYMLEEFSISLFKDQSRNDATHHKTQEQIPYSQPQQHTHDYQSDTDSNYYFPNATPDLTEVPLGSSYDSMNVTPSGTSDEDELVSQKATGKKRTTRDSTPIFSKPHQLPERTAYTLPTPPLTSTTTAETLPLIDRHPLEAPLKPREPVVGITTAAEVEVTTSISIDIEDLSTIGSPNRKSSSTISNISPKHQGREKESPAPQPIVVTVSSDDENGKVCSDESGESEAVATNLEVALIKESSASKKPTKDSDSHEPPQMDTLVAPRVVKRKLVSGLLMPARNNLKKPGDNTANEGMGIKKVDRFAPKEPQSQKPTIRKRARQVQSEDEDEYVSPLGSAYLKTASTISGASREKETTKKSRVKPGTTNKVDKIKVINKKVEQEAREKPRMRSKVLSRVRAQSKERAPLRINTSEVTRKIKSVAHSAMEVGTPDNRDTGNINNTAGDPMTGERSREKFQEQRRLRVLVSRRRSRSRGRSLSRKRATSERRQSTPEDDANMTNDEGSDGEWNGRRGRQSVAKPLDDRILNLIGDTWKQDFASIKGVKKARSVDQEVPLGPPQSSDLSEPSEPQEIPTAGDSHNSLLQDNTSPQTPRIETFIEPASPINPDPWVTGFINFDDLDELDELMGVEEEVRQKPVPTPLIPEIYLVDRMENIIEGEETEARLPETDRWAVEDELRRDMERQEDDYHEREQSRGRSRGRYRSRSRGRSMSHLLEHPLGGNAPRGRTMIPLPEQSSVWIASQGHKPPRHRVSLPEPEFNRNHGNGGRRPYYDHTNSGQNRNWGSRDDGMRGHLQNRPPYHGSSADHRQAADYRQATDHRQAVDHRQTVDYRQAADPRQNSDHRRRLSGKSHEAHTRQVTGERRWSRDQVSIPAQERYDYGRRHSKTLHYPLDQHHEHNSHWSGRYDKQNYNQDEHHHGRARDGRKGSFSDIRRPRNPKEVVEQELVEDQPRGRSLGRRQLGSYTDVREVHQDNPQSLAINQMEQKQSPQSVDPSPNEVVIGGSNGKPSRGRGCPPITENRKRPRKGKGKGKFQRWENPPRDQAEGPMVHQEHSNSIIPTSHTTKDGSQNQSTMIPNSSEKSIADTNMSQAPPPPSTNNPQERLVSPKVTEGPPRRIIKIAKSKNKVHTTTMTITQEAVTDPSVSVTTETLKHPREASPGERDSSEHSRKKNSVKGNRKLRSRTQVVTLTNGDKVDAQHQATNTRVKTLVTPARGAVTPQRFDRAQAAEAAAPAPAVAEGIKPVVVSHIVRPQAAESEGAESRAAGGGGGDDEVIRFKGVAHMKNMKNLKKSLESLDTWSFQVDRFA
ncbi:hypothetical protein BGX27_010295 [Mortierella sp. AM989]|nr:hypothetical protein BGX27_010295 [Mortierella sp. AM989]